MTSNKEISNATKYVKKKQDLRPASLEMIGIEPTTY